MWILYPGGFLSAVQKTGEPNVCVRARVASDLDDFRARYCPELSPTTASASASTDYPFRSWVSHDDFARAVSRLALAVNYPDFKHEVARRQGHSRADLYAQVWAMLLQLEAENPTPGTQQPKTPRSGNRRSR